MGRIGLVLRVFRRLKSGKNFVDILCSVGGKNKVSGYYMQMPGEDSIPLPTDQAMIIETQNGKYVVVGFIDPLNAGVSAGGERRSVGRDSSGAQVSQVYLKNDGTILASNAGGSFSLSPGGIFSATNSAGGIIELRENGDVALNGILFPKAGGIVPDEIGIDMATNGGDITYPDFVVGTHRHMITSPGITDEPVA